MFISDKALRAMYAGGRGNATARRYARTWAAVLGAGLAPRRWVTLEVPGRRTGRTTRFPLGMADWRGAWYLVSMLGEDCNWVRKRARRRRPGHHPARPGPALPVGGGPGRRPCADPAAVRAEGAGSPAAHAG